MPFNWKQLFFWHILFYFIGEPMRELLMTGNTEIPWELGSFKMAWLEVSSFLLFFVFTLSAYSSIYFFYTKQKWGLLIIGIVMSLILPIAIRYFVQEILTKALFGFSNYYDARIIPYTRDNLYFAFRYTVLGLGYGVVQHSLFKEQTQTALELEKQHIELSMLRSQINPHFLLNALNNIYALVFQKSDQSLEALDKLSDILKYGLYEKAEMVPIGSEVHYLENYIGLQRMRYAYPIQIEQEIDPEISDYMIPHFLLIPMIENAFKHGDLKCCPIRIHFYTKGDLIHFEVSNRIGQIEKDETGGIGLKNVRKRLSLLYGDQAICEAGADHEDYKLHIAIPIQ
ncbi:MAG: histidine kinase [Bacteroidota bacterium]